MYVLVSNGSATVCDADDCKSLDVRFATASDKLSGEAALEAAGLGHWTGGPEVDLSVESLHAQAAVSATLPDWQQHWDAMIAYAARSGWLSPDGSTVRAHVAELAQ